MLQKMEVFSSRPTTPAFDFNDDGTANSDMIQIRNIDGLDPVDAAINTTQYGNIDGAYYTGASLGYRNIVITMGLNPDYATYSMSDLRHVLYAYLMPKMAVTLQFTDSVLPVTQIQGYVENFQPNIFSQDPEIDVSIICPEPDFVGVEAVVVNADVAFGSYVYTDISYVGTADTSVYITVAVTEDASYNGDLYIVKPSNDPETFVIQDLDIDPAQYLEIDSTVGAKALNLVLATTKFSLIKTLDDGAIWPKLSPGDKSMAIVAVNSVASSAPAWEMTYYPHFGGL